MFKKARLLLTTLVVLLITHAGLHPRVSAAQNVTLTYTTWKTEISTAITKTLDAFMLQNPGVTVELQILDGSTYDQLLKPRIIGGDAPDVMAFMPSQYAAFVKEGWLLDVTDLPGTKIMNDSQPVVDSYAIDGKIYGAMVDGSINAFPIYYDKQYFEKLGVTPPTTLEEFYAVAEKIKADGREPLVFGGKDTWTFNTLMDGVRNSEWLAKYPNPDLALANGEVTASELNAASMAFFEDLVKRGIVTKTSLTMPYSQSIQYFLDGKAGMFPQGPWLPSTDEFKAVTDGDFGTFLFPYNKVDGKTFVLVGTDLGIGISSTTKFPEEAKALYNFLLEKSNLRTYLEDASSYTIIPGIGAKTNPILTDWVNAIYDVDAYTLSFGTAGGRVTLPGAYGNAIITSYANILAGSTAEEELKRLDEEFEKVKSQIIVSQ